MVGAQEEAARRRVGAEDTKPTEASRISPTARKSKAYTRGPVTSRWMLMGTTGPAAESAHPRGWDNHHLPVGKEGTRSVGMPLKAARSGWILPSGP